MLKNASKSICTSNAVVSPDLVSSSINFFTRKQRMILKKKMEISKWNTALYSPSTGAVTKKLLVRTYVTIRTFLQSGIFNNLAPVWSCASQINRILLWDPVPLLPYKVQYDFYFHPQINNVIQYNTVWHTHGVPEVQSMSCSLANKTTVLSLLQSEPSYSCWVIFY